MSETSLVVLASGYGSNLQALMDACASGELPARVAAVVCDVPAAYALQRAREAGIPAEPFPWKPFRQAGRTRCEYDTALAELVIAYRPDYVVLAGWMRLLSMAFLSHFPMRVINIHPALPGAFPGTHAIQRAWQAHLEGRCNRTGVMVHFVPNEGVDDGPVIASEEVSLSAIESLEQLETRIHAVEHSLLVAAIHSLIST